MEWWSIYERTGNIMSFRTSQLITQMLVALLLCRPKWLAFIPPLTCTAFGNTCSLGCEVCRCSPKIAETQKTRARKSLCLHSGISETSAMESNHRLHTKVLKLIFAGRPLLRLMRAWPCSW